MFRVELTRRDHAAILAGLRLLQSARAATSVQDIFTNGGTLNPLSNHEIDTLCERINTECDSQR